MLTHQISVDTERQVVVKRYIGGDRDEAARELRALRLLAEHAPRLAPELVSAELAADPPEVTMSLLPGLPLGGEPLTADQEIALTVALGQLWQSVPVSRVIALPGESDIEADLVRSVGGLLAAGGVGEPALAADPVVRLAIDRGTAWLSGAAWPGRVVAGADDRTRLRRESEPGLPLVFGHGDPDLDNYLWDGDLVRIVDFEHSGISDRAFELATLLERVPAWRDAALDAESFLDSFDLSAAERSWLADWRRLAALYWLLRLLPGGPSGGGPSAGRSSAGRSSAGRSSADGPSAGRSSAADSPDGALRAQAGRLLSLL